MHYVFISYSRTDREFVERLAAAFKLHSRPAWVDWKDIPPTAAFMEEIFRAIDSADSFIFVLSPESCASPVCRQEIDRAVKGHKRLLPIVCRGVNTGIVHPALAELNWIFFDGEPSFDSAFGLLATAIDTDLAWVQFHTELLVRATEWDSEGRRRSALLRGEDLTLAEQRLVQATDGREPRPTQLQQEFVTLSRRDSSRRLRTIAGAVSAALVLTTALAVFSFVQSQLAESRRKEADTQRQLAVNGKKEADRLRVLADQRAMIANARRIAADSGNQLTVQLDLAMLLSVESYRTSQTIEAKNALLASLQQSPYLERFLQGHTGPVRSVAFDPKGRLLASGGTKESIVWDLPSGKLLRKLKGTWMNQLAFSPDSSILGGGDWSGVGFWNVRTGQQIGQELRGRFLGFNSRGGALLVQGKQVMEFNPQTGKLTDTPLKTLDTLDYARYALAPDSAFLASSSTSLDFWDLNTGASLGRPATIPHQVVTNLVFDPLRRFVLAGDFDGGLTFWDFQTGKPSGDRIAAHAIERSDVYVAESADGKMAASSGGDSRIRLWLTDTRREIGGALLAHRSGINGIAFSPDGKTLASAGEDGSVILWHVVVPQVPGQTLGGHSIMLPQVDRFGAAPIRAPSENENNVFALLSQSALRLQFDAQGASLAVGTGSGLLQVWNVAERKPRMALVRFFPNIVESLAINSDGTLLAAGGSSVAPGDPNSLTKEKVELIRIPSGHRFAEPLQGGQFFGQSLAFSPDAKTLVICGYDDLSFYDLAARRIIDKVKSGIDQINSLVFHPDGRTFIVSGGTVARPGYITTLWDLSTRKKIRVLSEDQSDDEAKFLAIAFNGNGSLVAAADGKGWVSLRDGASFEPLALPFRTGSDEVRALEFSLDGKVLATGGTRGVQLWDVETRQAIGGPIVNPPFSYAAEQGVEMTGALAFNPSEKVLLTAYPFSQTLVRWDLDPESWIRRICGAANRKLTDLEWAQYVGTDVTRRSTCQAAK